jgi:hypothetical protein
LIPPENGCGLYLQPAGKRFELYLEHAGTRAQAVLVYPEGQPAGREIMNGKENPIELLVICAVMLVLSILGVAGGLSPRLFGSLDGLLIVAICLMTALIFAILLFILAKERGWIGKRHSDGGATPPPSPAK